MPLTLGAYIPGAPENPAAIDDYANLVGAMPRIVMWFQNWDQGFEPAYAEAVAQRGATPLLTWEPWDRSLLDIAAGAHDAYLQDFASRIAGWGKPFYLRFGHEMNGDWYPWAGGNGKDYIAAWRHVHDVFKAAHAANVRWVWSPNNGGPKPFELFYPGGQYVDWLGIDGYNWGPTQTSWGSHWSSFLEMFYDAYHRVRDLSIKPMMIGETSCTEIGGDKAEWIRHGFLEEMPCHFPAVEAITWFNINKEQDWRVDSSPEALKAFRKVAASPLYQGSLP